MNCSGAYSPPCQGGVAAPSTKWSRSEEARTGWSITSYVSQCVLQRVVWLTTLYVSRCRAHAARPSVALRWLRGSGQPGAAALQGSCIGGGVRSILQNHLHSVFRPQRDHRLKRDRVVGYVPQTPLLSQRRENHDCLHPRKSFTDATAWPASERKVRKLRPRGARFRRPAIGIKTRWIWKITRVMLHDIRTHDHDRAGGHNVRRQPVVLQCAAAHDPCRWIQTN